MGAQALLAYVADTPNQPSPAKNGILLSIGVMSICPHSLFNLQNYCKCNFILGGMNVLFFRSIYF